MNHLEELESLAQRRDLRSADRANIVNMVAQLRRGKPLDYQQRLNAWAYIVRYKRQPSEQGR